MEQEVRDETCNVAGAICDALRYIGDASYAILPRELAHDIGNFNKNFLSNLKDLLDKDMQWIDDRVAGGDRMREEWRRRCQRDEPPAAEPVI